MSELLKLVATASSPVKAPTSPAKETNLQTTDEASPDAKRSFFAALEA
jgi:hypothetical protein